MLKRNFVAGKMNLDSDERLLPPGEYRSATNIYVSKSESSDVGAIENSLGNRQLTNIDIGANQKCVGICADQVSNRVYIFIVSDTSSAIYEWDDNIGAANRVLLDTRAGNLNVLNFDPDFYITGVQIITDSDNDRRFLLWTDNNMPRLVNIEKAKGFAENGFDKYDISLAKRPPLEPPTIELATSSNLENFIEEQFIAFAYRYRYEDQAYSAVSPFTEWAFEPKSFDYDYSTSTNESMVNKYNQVNITVNTGDSRVLGFDIVYKKSDSEALFVMESYDKAELGLKDSEPVSFPFLTSKSPRQLPSDEIGRLFDNVPRQANSLEVIDNIIVLADFLESYNLVDSDNNKINFNYSLSYDSSPAAAPYRSMKSNRDYEAVIVYKDDFGRMTTGISSPGNSVFIPNKECVNNTKLFLTIPHEAPAWASYYQIFLKQTKTDYQTITPIVFHQDGKFVWIKIEGDSVSKIREGDVLYVKSDTNGVLNSVAQTEVLEVRVQPENFLEALLVETLEQESGTYFKIKPDNFALNKNKAKTFKAESQGFRGVKVNNDIDNNVSYIDAAVYYGDDGLNDLSSGGTYTGTTDIRYLVRISAVGAQDSFEWSDNDGGSWNGPTAITAGNPNALSNGVTATFASQTGHKLSDEWVIPAKSDDVVTPINNDGRAWVPYQAKTLGDETIIAGAQITISYKETRGGLAYASYVESFISSSNYANMEEWFYGDNIISQLIYPQTIDNVVFRRGTPQLKNGVVETINMDATKGLWMLFVSQTERYGDETVSVDASIEVTELENNIIFETKPLEEPANVFYEIGRTYQITGGLHMGAAGDINQTATTPATIYLNAFTCFSWGNGIESYKIKDKLNGTPMKLYTRATSSVQDYRENRRVASMTWGGRYEQSTNYNALNEFNLSTGNWLDLDDHYGAIKKLYSHKDRLIAFMEDRLHPIGYKKKLIFDNQGNSSLVTSEDLFNKLEPYAGEYGISGNPESFAVHGNMMYFADQRRNKVLRLSMDGVTEISEYGMSDFFRDEFLENKKNFRLGAYDPYQNQYVLSSIDDTTPDVPILVCGSKFEAFQREEPLAYTFKFSGYNTRLTLSYDAPVGSISIAANWNGTQVSVSDVSGTGTLVIDRTDLEIDEVSVYVAPVTSSNFTISHACEEVGIGRVKIVVVNDLQDSGGGKFMTNRYNINAGPYVFSDSSLFTQGGTTLFRTLVDFDGQGAIPANGATVGLEAYNTISDHRFYKSQGNVMGYLVSSTDYGPADVGTILSSATFPESFDSDDGTFKTSSNSFVLAKSPGDILYLIWDYRDIRTDALDDAANVFQGQSTDISVLANDFFLEPVTVTIETPPVNGTATVLSNGTIRYRHNGTATVSDSIVYRITTPYGTDTATVNITVDAEIPGGGGGGNPGIAFSLVVPGDAVPDVACTLVGTTTKYHDGFGVYPTLDDFVYNDSAKTNPFNGLNLYYKMPSGYAIRVNSTGRITDYYYCTPGGGGGSA